MKKPRLLIPALLVVAGAAYAFTSLRPSTLTLTGLVTTNDVVVSPQLAGQLAELRVSEGDSVRKGQLLAVIAPDELRADTAYYAQNAAGVSSQVKESEAALRFEESATDHQTAQAVSNLAASEAQVQAAAADLEAARATYARTQDLARQQIASAQDLDQARAAAAAAQAKLDAVRKQVDAQRAAVALARANAEQVAVRRSQVQASQHQEAAAAAQRAKADVRLAYTELHAPIDGFVDVRAARAGEYVNAGQPVVTLVNPDDLWVRADVEETYIDRVRIGDTLAVRLPSGAPRTGTRCSTAASTPASRPSATSAAPSATSRPSRSGCASTTRTARSRVGMTAYVALPVR